MIHETRMNRVQHLGWQHLTTEATSQLVFKRAGDDFRSVSPEGREHTPARRVARHLLATLPMFCCHFTCTSSMRLKSPSPAAASTEPMYRSTVSIESRTGMLMSFDSSLGFLAAVRQRATCALVMPCREARHSGTAAAVESDSLSRGVGPQRR